MKVIKRDGHMVDWCPEKIEQAIMKANNEVEEEEQASSTQIKNIIKHIEKLGKKRILVEDIQDIIEVKLMSIGKYELAKKYMPKGTCGVISFGVKGGRKAAEDFMGKLKIGMIATHVADSRTCVLHPASATHRQLSDQELIDCGVSPDMIRLSVGVENVNDLIADLKNALEN